MNATKICASDIQNLDWIAHSLGNPIESRPGSQSSGILPLAMRWSMCLDLRTLLSSHISSPGWAWLSGLSSHRQVTAALNPSLPKFTEISQESRKDGMRLFTRAWQDKGRASRWKSKPVNRWDPTKTLWTRTRPKIKKKTQFFLPKKYIYNDWIPYNTV